MHLNCRVEHLSLFQFNNLIKTTLERELDPAYWIIAEIGEMRPNAKGHCYLDLVEKEGDFIQAKMKANIWSYTYSKLKSQFEIQAQTTLRPGLKVLVKTRINFHETYGLSLNIIDIDPNFTLGEKSKQRDATLARLREEKLFDKNQQHVLPLVPQRIAVISSETAAGYGDFVDQLKQNARGFDFHLALYPTVMQGDQTAPTMEKAIAKIREFKDQYDVIVIIRGGGAQADFDAYDSFDVAKSIALAPLPVITGIGHARDESVADMVAHTSLKTPTAVADFLLSGVESYQQQLIEQHQRMSKAIHQIILGQEQELVHLASMIRLQARQSIQEERYALERNKSQLQHHVEKKTEHEKNKLNLWQEQIKWVDPQTLFAKGYTLTLKKGKPIHTQTIVPGDELVTHTGKQNIKSQVKEIEHE